MTQPPTIPEIGRLVLWLRGQRVILDTDLAALYGVETLRLNEAAKRNLARFPPDFMVRLSKAEWISVQVLRSQIAILKAGRGRHRKYLPVAFSEHGALMAANILSSPRAVAMSVYVIRAFVRMREDQASNAAMLNRLTEIDRTLLVHDTALREIWEKLRPLLTPPPASPKPEIGFHVREDPAPYRARRKARPDPNCPLEFEPCPPN